MYVFAYTNTFWDVSLEVIVVEVSVYPLYALCLCHTESNIILKSQVMTANQAESVLQLQHLVDKAPSARDI